MVFFGRHLIWLSSPDVLPEGIILRCLGDALRSKDHWWIRQLPECPLIWLSLIYWRTHVLVSLLVDVYIQMRLVLSFLFSSDSRCAPTAGLIWPPLSIFVIFTLFRDGTLLLTPSESTCSIFSLHSWRQKSTQQWQRLMVLWTHVSNICTKWLFSCMIWHRYTTKVYFTTHKKWCWDQYYLNHCAFPVDDEEEESAGLPTKSSEEFKPFIRRLPEFKAWLSAQRRFLDIYFVRVACINTLFFSDVALHAKAS